MKVMIDIPEEFERDLRDKFNEFFERMIADIDFALEKQEPLLCGNYERETAEMFLSAFEKATIIPDNATNGDTLKLMFPSIESRLDESTGIILVKWVDGTTKTFKERWWNAPYMEGAENDKI